MVAIRCVRAGWRRCPRAHQGLGRRTVEHVGGADEVGDEPVGRILIDLTSGADLLDAAVVEHRQPIAQCQCLVLIVGDDHERDADLALDGLEFDLHLLAQLEVERAERLVEQQNPGPADQCAGQRHPLLLSAGQLRGFPAGVTGQSHHLQGRGGAVPAFGLSHP